MAVATPKKGILLSVKAADKIVLKITLQIKKVGLKQQAEICSKTQTGESCSLLPSCAMHGTTKILWL